MPSSEPHLVFDAGGRTFAIPGSRVVEVVRYGEAAVDLVSADLSSILGGQPAAIGPNTCTVIVDVDRAGGRRSVGLVVDAATDIIVFGDGDLVIPDFGPHIDLAYLTALARMNGTFTIVLNVDRLLSDLVEGTEVS